MSPDATLVDYQQQQLVDDVMSAYVKWREACLRVREAYRAWQTGCATEVDTFSAYVVALDREELTCQIYADLITRLERRVRTRPRERSRT